MHAPLSACRAWPIWEFARWLTGYIVAGGPVYLGVLSVVAQSYTLVPAPDVIFGALSCAAPPRRADQNALVITLADPPTSTASGTSHRDSAAPGLRDAGAVIRWVNSVAGFRQIPLHRRVFHRGDYRAVLRGDGALVPRALPYWVRVGTLGRWTIDRMGPVP